MKNDLSALLDGDLDEQAAERVFDGLRRDAGLRRDWDAFCLVGDALRLRHSGAAPDFVARVMERLDVEPVLLAPPAEKTGRPHSRWQALMPLAASVMGVAAVGWVAMTLSAGQESRGPALAANHPPAVPAEGVAVLPTGATIAAPGGSAAVEDARLQYLFVHQGVAGGPVSGAVQYIRAVSENQQENRP